MIMPIILMGGGICATVKLGGFWLLHPIKFCRRLKEAGDGSGTSPAKALATALAGTLGVGNMAGVATALTAGGPGALFWMWISAICAMGIKYAEVSLAVIFRKKESEKSDESEKNDKVKGKNDGISGGRRTSSGKKGSSDSAKVGRSCKESTNSTATLWKGGAMYYIQALHPGKFGAALAIAFAALLCINSLLTGTIVQVNSAASVFPKIPAVLAGAMFAVPLLFAAGGGGRRIMQITASLVPALTAVFTALSLYIIIKNFALIPDAMREVFRCAFDFSPVGEASGAFSGTLGSGGGVKGIFCGFLGSDEGVKDTFGGILSSSGIKGTFGGILSSNGIKGIFGGILGSGAAAAMRYGVTRGIFSNEAGCGTSPTAHAAANTKSPHHQGCFGVFEVFADTIALCSLTAAVLLIAPVGGDGIPRTIAAYSYFAGDAAGYIMGVSIWLFALATVLCQCYYGMEAAEYLRERLCSKISAKTVQRIFTLFSAAACIVGSVISQGLMWIIADGVISLMTAVNVICVLPGVGLAAAELRRIEGHSGDTAPDSGETLGTTARLRRPESSTDRPEEAPSPHVTAGRPRRTAARKGL